MTGIQNDAGVSVIVGTLLLILITVTAAAGLAIMVSQMQKDEMNRQSHLAAVKSEKIEILNIGLKNDPGAWNQSPFNITENQSWNNWSSISLTLSILNTEDVKVIGIAINDRYTRNYWTVTDTPVEVNVRYNLSNQEYLTLPGTKSQKIRINFTDDFPFTQYIKTENQIHVRIMTSIYNTFEKTFKPPNPVFETHIETEDLGVTQRDVIMLDGSRSTADNAVVRWDWTIQDLNNETVVIENTTSGKVVRWNPLSPGPFRVWLMVTDDVGMTRNSSYVDIPVNTRFVPPTYLKIENITPYLDDMQQFKVTLTTINGDPVANRIVNYIKNDPYNNLTLDVLYGTTDINGETYFNLTGGKGSVKAIYEKISSNEIIVPV